MIQLCHELSWLTARQVLPDHTISEPAMYKVRGTINWLVYPAPDCYANEK